MQMKTRQKWNLSNRSYDTIFIVVFCYCYFSYKSGMFDKNLPTCPPVIGLIKIKCHNILNYICNILAARIEGKGEFYVFKNHPTKLCGVKFMLE